MTEIPLLTCTYVCPHMSRNASLMSRQSFFQLGLVMLLMAIAFLVTAPYLVNILRVYYSTHHKKFLVRVHFLLHYQPLLHSQACAGCDLSESMAAMATAFSLGADCRPHNTVVPVHVDERASTHLHRIYPSHVVVKRCAGDSCNCILPITVWEVFESCSRLRTS